MSRAQKLSRPEIDILLSLVRRGGATLPTTLLPEQRRIIVTLWRRLLVEIWFDEEKYGALSREIIGEAL